MTAKIAETQCSIERKSWIGMCVYMSLYLQLGIHLYRNIFQTDLIRSRIYNTVWLLYALAASNMDAEPRIPQWTDLLDQAYKVLDLTLICHISSRSHNVLHWIMWWFILGFIYILVCLNDHRICCVYSVHMHMWCFAFMKAVEFANREQYSASNHLATSELQLLQSRGYMYFRREPSYISADCTSTIIWTPRNSNYFRAEATCISEENRLIYPQTVHPQSFCLVLRHIIMV